MSCFYDSGTRVPLGGLEVGDTRNLQKIRCPCVSKSMINRDERTCLFVLHFQWIFHHGATRETATGTLVSDDRTTDRANLKPLTFPRSFLFCQVIAVPPEVRLVAGFARSPMPEVTSSQ